MLALLSLDPPPDLPPMLDNDTMPGRNGGVWAGPRPTGCGDDDVDCAPSGEKCSGPNEATRSRDPCRPSGALDDELRSDDVRDRAGCPCG